MDDRRSSSDKFAWAVPTVIVASQAFLIPFALDSGIEPARRAFATVAAFILSLAAGHFFLKQMFAIHLCEEVAQRERAALELSQVDRNSLLADAKTLGSDFQRRWLVTRNREPLVVLNRGRAVLQAAVVHSATVTRVWLVTIGFVLLADAVLFFSALWDLLS